MFIFCYNKDKVNILVSNIYEPLLFLCYLNIMEQFFKYQFILFVAGAIFLVVWSFYVEALDNRGDKRKNKYLNIFKTALVVYSVWFILSSFYVKFFTVIPYK